MAANNNISDQVTAEITKEVTNKNTESLSVFMAAVMALPGMAAAQWDPNVRNDHVVLSYNHSVYEEPSGQPLLNGLEFVQGNIVVGPISRMHVVSDQLSVTVPIADRYEVKLNAVQDIMTGASVALLAPIAVADPNNHSNQVIPVTVPSAPDRRRAVDITGAYYGNDHYVDLRIGESSENDYKSKFVSSSYRRYFNDKTTTLTIGGSFSDDLSWAHADPNSPIKVACPACSYAPGEQKRYSHELLVGVSQILDRNSVAQFVIGNTYSYGNLNDPYRLTGIFLNGTQFAGFVFDNRPDYNSQWSALARYSRYFQKTNSALHLDYRYIHDSWGANSHTLEGKWRIDLGSGWIISPGLRYYTQEAADFYQPYLTAFPSQFTPVTPLALQLPAGDSITSDYRLSGFGVISPKFEVVKTFDSGLLLRASYEKMIRKHSYALFGSTGFSGEDFNSQLLSLSVDYAF